MSVSVSLMGGLGNQLFQLSFGLSLAQEKSFNLIPVLGNSRRNALGQVEISSLNIPENVHIQEDSFFNSRMVSAALGRGLRAASSQKNKILVKGVELVVPTLSMKSDHKIRFAWGVGSDISEAITENVLYMGYFQSHEFASRPAVLSKLMEISPKTSSYELEKYVLEVKENKPILIHVRLTDYLKEGSFGLPSKVYYKNAIERLSSVCGETDIWVFSDDPANALSFLPNEFENRYRSAPVFEETSHNFELMRYFSGYIIANSSFSWWAAHLRKNLKSPVVHPWPWFKQAMHRKEDLIPENWISFPSGI